jgi:hypothetical protein
LKFSKINNSVELIKYEYFITQSQIDDLNFIIADIQEFYELTLLDESKTVQQKTAETLLIASKWEQENSIKLTDVSKAKKTHFIKYIKLHSDIRAS